MAPSLSLTHMHQFLPLLLVYALIQFQPSSSNDLVTEICNHNDDSAYCTQIFNSDGRTPGADLNGLGEIAIDKGLALATNISNLIIWKNNTATDPNLVKYFGICFVLYDSSKDKLVSASDALLARRDYGSMNTNAHLAQQDGLDCESTFYGPPPVQSPITIENRHFVDLTHATVVISNMLMPH
ncbi:hypothetical protein MRB53_022798 [Persea americana]|uniref:Uncharacterized protein n=1 Tax=Persea americana TaxID=3435 RepID=A0ACC2L7Q9_PERAE|nr:hypothetical protein MRB53_022798 [Persea americana]